MVSGNGAKGMESEEWEAARQAGAERRVWPETTACGANM